jgi:hypothetical protein
VDEVRERGTQPPEEARHAQSHAQLLHTGPQLDRLDSFGEELRPARDRRETKIRGDLRERLQQPRDVRLVAGALPAQDVGVDDDQRNAQPAASL